MSAGDQAQPMTSRTCLITGGNSGLGYEAARAIAAASPRLHSKRDGMRTLASFTMTTLDGFYEGPTRSSTSVPRPERRGIAMSSVKITNDDWVRVITIDRPRRRNAVDVATATALVDAFVAADADDSVRVVILTGAGGAFCSGADLRALAEGEHRTVGPDGAGPMGPTRLRMGKPTIAAIEGPAVAGGLELALWCDLRVVATDAILGVYCRRWGVPLVDLGTIRLPRLIGHSRAMDLILTGRGIDGTEAERIGLANRITEPGHALAVATELAHQLAALPQHCLHNDRLSTIEQWDLDEAAAMRNEIWRGRDTLASGESLQGAGRFAAGQGRHGQAAHASPEGVR